MEVLPYSAHVSIERANKASPIMDGSCRGKFKGWVDAVEDRGLDGGVKGEAVESKRVECCEGWESSDRAQFIAFHIRRAGVKDTYVDFLNASARSFSYCNKDSLMA